MQTQTTEERGQIRMVPVRALHTFRGHPFKVTDDAKMQELVDSIREQGVMTPVVVRPMEAVEFRDAMNEIKYLTNGKKTVEGFFTGAMNCRLEHAIADMQELKKLYRKTEGRILTCGVISFTERDKDLAKCWAAGKAMLRENYGENYQVVYSMHTNTEHPHIHFLINTVGLNGRKLHMKQGYVREVLQPVVNRYCRAYDLAVNENFGKKKIFDRKMTNSEIAIDMDAAIEKAESLPEFVMNMKLMGYRISVGKSLTVQREDMGKGRWTNLVGADYSLERVMERIRDKRKRPDPANLEGISKGVISKQNGRVLIPAVRWKNMTGFQKENVRLLFAQGRNPFQEQWVNQKIQQRNRKLFEERRQAFVCVKHGILEPGGMNTALQKIRQRQEKLAERKRVITEPLKKQKAMFKLVRRAEELETRALSGINDSFYEPERLEFERIIDRLERNFGQDYTELKEYWRMAVE